MRQLPDGQTNEVAAPRSENSHGVVKAQTCLASLLIAFDHD